MLRQLLALLLPVLLCACAIDSPSVPEGYKGALAVVQDSVATHSSSQADFFYLSHLDGKKIKDSLIQTRMENRGHGMSMSPAVLNRQVPARPAVFRIVGRTEYAAPILALTHTVYEVAGEISFTPEPDKIYVVKGELGAAYSAVWLEESGSGAIVDHKIEIKGSAKLGTFEK
jgi:hypothetical protein